MQRGNLSSRSVVESRRQERPSSSRWSDSAAFLRGFLEKPLEVASVVPSSTFLEAKVIEAADLAAARCVVELGPGTGGTTRALLRSMAPSARLLAIDLNDGFCTRLAERITDPRLLVQCGSADALATHLAHWRLPSPDVIVSGIPFSTMPADVAQRIAAAIATNLAPGGRFIAYQMRPHVAHYLTPQMGRPAMRWEWRNIPPMRVFRWDKPAA